MKTNQILLTLAIALAPFTSWADIYKCQEKGKTVFSDQPCGNVVSQRENNQVKPGIVSTAPITYTQKEVQEMVAQANSKPTVASLNPHDTGPELKRQCDFLEQQKQSLRRGQRTQYFNNYGMTIEDQIRQIDNKKWSLGCKYL